MSLATIDDLPPKIVLKVFKNLSLNDLVACSMVNKYWNSIYSDFKLDRLAIIFNYNYLLANWYPDRKTEEKELCQTKQFGRLAGKPLLSNLKQLALCGPSEINLSKLSKFNNLQHLEIDIKYLLERKVNLKLAKLKVLAFHQYNNRCSLTIDCPELNTLVYFEDPDESLLDVKHPWTIKRLETNMLGSKIDQFKSVECLVTDQFEAVSYASLFSLPRLSELRYNVCFSDHHGDFREVGTVDQMKRTLREFLRDLKVLRDPEFKFRFCGFQLNQIEVDKIDFGAEVIERFGLDFEMVTDEGAYMKNYHLIEPNALRFVSSVDYNRLMDSLTGEIPACFFQKFSGIKTVYIGGALQNPNHFLWFLKSSKSLRSLSLDCPVLGQDLLDRLSSSAPHLFDLELSGDSKRQLSFRFLANFLHLKSLRLHQDLSFESLNWLVRHFSGKLEYCFLRFQLKEKQLNIVKCFNVWELCGDLSQDVFTIENPDEVVAYVDELRTSEIN